MADCEIHSRRIFIAITGASGGIYAERLINFLTPRVGRVYCCFTESGRKVVDHELKLANNPGELSLRQLAAGEVPAEWRSVIRMFRNDDLFAPVASGSSAPTDMIVLPCSMGTLSRISSGASTNLIERSSDVMLKQKSRLIVCPRETPFNLIHLRNMTALAEAGAIILPLIPAFYSSHESVSDLVDFMIGRILEMMGISHDLYQKWNSRMV